MFGASTLALVATLTTSTFIPADSPQLRYIGRIGFEDPKAPSLHYSGSTILAKFNGPYLAVSFEEDDYGVGNWIGVRIDGGNEMRQYLAPKSNATYVIATGLSDRWHTAEIYRRSDPMVGWCKFKGLVLAPGKGLGDLPPRSNRRIEFFGDSVMSGSMCEAVGFEGKQDSEVTLDNSNEMLTNGYWSFGSIAARKLKAEAQLNGVGGLSLLDGTGWWCGPNTIGFESTFDKLNPIAGQHTKWDFSRFTSHVVVISIGQNDAHGMDIGQPEMRKKWVETFAKVLDTLSGHYPKAKFVLTTTVLMHDLRFDEALKEIAAQMNARSGKQVAWYCGFKRAGKATPGHPRVAEDVEMGEELAAFVGKLPGVWGP